MSQHWTPEVFIAPGYRHTIRSWAKCFGPDEQINVFYRRVMKPRVLWEYCGTYKLCPGDLRFNYEPKIISTAKKNGAVDDMTRNGSSYWNERIHRWAAGKKKDKIFDETMCLREKVWLKAMAKELVDEREFWEMSSVVFCGYDETVYEVLVQGDDSAQ